MCKYSTYKGKVSKVSYPSEVGAGHTKCKSQQHTHSYFDVNYTIHENVPAGLLLASMHTHFDRGNNLLFEVI